MYHYYNTFFFSLSSEISITKMMRCSILCCKNKIRFNWALLYPPITTPADVSEPVCALYNAQGPAVISNGTAGNCLVQDW